MAVGRGGFHASHFQGHTVTEVLAQLGLPGEGEQPVARHIRAEGERQMEPLAAAISRLPVQRPGGLGVVAGPGLGITARQAWRHQIAQGRPQPQGDAAADGVTVQAQGHRPAHHGPLQRRLIGEQGEVADFQGWPLPFLEMALQGRTVQGSLLVNLQAGGEQHVHFATGQGAIEGCGIAEGHQVDPTMGRPAAPVARKRLESLLLIAEEAEAIGPGADEAVVEEAAAMEAVGRGRQRGEVHRAQQGSHGAERALEPEFKAVGAWGAHALNPVAQQVAQFPDGQEPLQGEHHGGRIEGRAVVEAHALA